MNEYKLIFLIFILILSICFVLINIILKINRNREKIKFKIVKTPGLYKNTFNFEGIIFNKGYYPIYIDTIFIIEKKTKKIKEEIPCYSYCILPKEELSFNLNRYSMRSHIIEILTELGNSKKASLNI